MEIEQVTTDHGEEEVVQGQLVIQFTRTAQGLEKAFLDRVLGSESFRVLQPTDENGVCLIELKGGKERSLREIRRQLSEESEIEFAAFNGVMSQDGVAAPPNDPLLSQQWGLDRIQIREAWHYSTVGPRDLLVAVADSGIPIQNGELSHEDLDREKNFLVGSDFISGGSTAVDDNGHGTHVLGIIAARGRNRKGMAGAAFTCATLSIKVFNAGGAGTVFALYQAALEAVSVARSRNARLIFNLSGGGRAPNPTWNLAARVLRDAGALFVAAAGNDASFVGYPAALSPLFDNLIAVGATNRDDSLASFSNRGPEINVVAPGVDILSTFPDYPVAGGYPLNYGAISGTSMATPLVSALAAIVWDQFRFYDAARVRRRLEETALDLGAPGRDNLFGFGRIDAKAALDTLPLDPGEAVPVPQFWPNAPHPPPTVSVFLEAIHGIGAGMAIVEWFLKFNKPLDAAQRLKSLGGSIAKSGALRVSEAFRTAQNATTIANVEVALADLRQQAEAAEIYKAPWLNLRELFDVGYAFRYVEWFAPRGLATAEVLERLDGGRDAVLRAGIYGEVLLEYEDFREMIDQAGDGLEIGKLVKVFEAKLSQSLRPLTGVIRQR